MHRAILDATRRAERIATEVDDYLAIIIITSHDEHEDGN
jgi:hypothetical protein